MPHKQIISQLNKCLEEKGKAILATSGGSSPVRLHQQLAQESLDWSKITITLVDERQVPPGHQDSNQRQIRETLLTDKAVAAHFIPLEEWSPSEIPDIAILGMGADGHFASLFPSMLARAALDPTAPPEVIRTEPAGNPNHPRITMSLSMILAIPFRILLVSGQAKESTLAEAQAGEEYPITRLLAQSGTHIERIADA